MDRIWRLKRPRASGALAVWLSLSATLVFIGLVSIAPGRAPYVSINLETELLRYRVVRQPLAGVFVRNATYSGQLNCAVGSPPGKLTGLLMPAAGSVVSYRWGPDGVAINIEALRDHAASISFADERTCTFDGASATVVLYNAMDGEIRLPIAGQAEAGSENSAATASSGPRGLIHIGELKVFGRTALGDELYPVADATYPIPRGSRLASGRDFRSVDAAQSGAAWYGSATFGTRSLTVSVTTDATRLLLYRPGVGDQTESFSFGLFTRIFNDPSLGLLTLSFGVFFLLASAITGWMSLWKRSE